MNRFSKILSVLIVVTLFVPLVNGANDPGHDSLYIERAGDNVSGTFNFSGTFYVPSPGSDMEAATRKYVDDTVNAANDSIWNQSGSDIYYSGGNVGIGTNSPNSSLEVNGSLEVGASNALYLNDSSGNLGLGTTPDVPLHLEFTGNDTDAGGGGQGEFFIDAEQSSIDTEPVFRVNVPSSGDRKAFQLGMQGKSWSWASFSFTAGPNNKPGFMLGDSESSRDVGVFRQGTNNLRLYNDVSVSGDLDLLSDNISNVGNLTASGTIEANRFVGDGSGLTNISSSGGSLWTNSSGNATYTDGNVGIGTTSPSYPAQIVGSPGGDEPVLQVNGTGGEDGGIRVNVGGTGSADEILDVQSGETSRFYVRGDGNVGIGNDDPDQELSINARGFNSSEQEGGLILSATSLGTNDYAPALQFDAQSESGDDDARAAIAGVQETNNNDVFGLAFLTHNETTNGGALGERMRIDQDGNVGIGTKSPSAQLNLDARNDSELLFTATDGNSGTHQIGFAHGSSNAPRAAIFSQSAGNWNQGKLIFALSDTDDSNSNEVTPGDAYITLDPDSKDITFYQPLNYAYDTLAIGENGNSGTKAFRLSRSENKAAIFSVPEGSFGGADLRFSAGDPNVADQYGASNASFKISYNEGFAFGKSYIGKNPAAENMIIAGNVGMGLTNPNNRLDVNGTGRFRGNLNVTSGNDVCIEGGNCLSTVGGGGSLWTNSSGDATYTSGNVGIGTTTPSTALQIDNGSLSFTGGNAIVDIGENHTIYNGSNQVMIGDNLQAGVDVVNETSGYHIVIGDGASTRVSGVAPGGVKDGNIAIGKNARADGTGSIAIGRGSTYQSKDSSAVVVGAGASAGSGNSPTAVGAGSSASGNQATAFGSGANAGSTFSVAIGELADATGKASISLGQNADATKTSSIAIGRKSDADYEGSIGIGRDADPTAKNQLKIGSSSYPINEVLLGVNGSGSPLIYADNTGIGLGGVTNTSSRLDVNGTINVSNGDICLQSGNCLSNANTNGTASPGGSQGAVQYNDGSGGFTGNQNILNITPSDADTDVVIGTPSFNSDSILEVGGDIHSSSYTVQDWSNGYSFTGGTNSGLSESNLRISGDIRLDAEDDSYIKTNNTGLGTSTPTARLDVNGSLRVRNASGSDILYANKSSGNVGIGTDNPTSSLYINDSYNPTINIDSDNSGGSGLSIMSGDSDNVEFDTESYDRYYFKTTGDTRLFIDDDQSGNGEVGINTTSPSNALTVGGTADFTDNVGIGTTSPSYKLDVNGSINLPINANIRRDGDQRIFFGGSWTQFYSSMRFNDKVEFKDNLILDNNGGVTLTNPATNNFVVKTNSSESVRVDENGNVGIGTTSPSRLLDVSGTAQASTSFETGSLTLHNSNGLYRGNSNRANVRFGSQKANGARPLILASGDGSSYTDGEVNINVDGETKTKINSTDTEINNDVNVNGSVTLDPDGSKPSCTSSNAGEMWFDDRNGSNGNDDLLYTCMENSTAGHNWVLVARGG